MAQLEDVFWFVEVFEVVGAEVVHLGAAIWGHSSLVTEERRIWPPCPADMMRAARFSVGPK